MKNFKKTAIEIYLLYKQHHGVLAVISGLLRRDDSSRLSRQINPHNDDRDNFYEELLEVHYQMKTANPELEKQIWAILCRVRDGWYDETAPCRKRAAEKTSKLLTELSQFVYKNETDAPQDEVAKEAYDLIVASKEVFESVNGEMSRDEIRETYFAN